MKRILSYAAVIILTSIVSIIAFDALQGGDSPKKGVVITDFHSLILKEKRDLIISLPRLYDSTKRYPVLYVLDGSSLDKPLVENLEVLSMLGLAPEAIVVGIPNMTAENRQKNLVPPFMHTDQENMTSAMGEGDVFLEFLEDELVPFVEQQYPGTSRTFCGNSRGGLLVMYSMIRKPELFDARFCFSTPFWRENDILIDSVKLFLDTRDSLNTFLFMSAGSDETENIRGGLERMTTRLSKSAIRGMIVSSSITPKAIHADNAILSIPQALEAWGRYTRAMKND